jgi:hypothetical protein
MCRRSIRHWVSLGIVLLKRFVLSIDTEQIPKAYGYPAAVVTNLLSAMPTNYNLLQKQPVF